MSSTVPIDKNRVEPRGFEPLTSAEQRRHDTLLGLSRVCKIAANSNFLSGALCYSFQEIYSGCCTDLSINEIG